MQQVACPLYTVDETAAILKVHSLTVRRYLRSGKIQGLKLLQQWRIPASEIDRLVSQGFAVHAIN